jgi:hypothetical protein
MGLNGESTIKMNLLIDTVETPVEVPVYYIARHITEGQIADLLDDYMNKYSNEYNEGQRIGKMLQTSHRTLQGSVCRLLVGILVGMGDTEYFDARNEKAVALGKQIKAMIEKGEMNFGYMI